MGTAWLRHGYGMLCESAFKELGSKVVPVHALKMYRWRRSISPSIGEPRIFLWGGLTMRPELFGGADTKAGIIWWGAHPEAVCNLSFF